MINKYKYKFIYFFITNYRVFSDRLVDVRDNEAFVTILSDKLGILFDTTFHSICPDKKPPVFGDYMGTEEIYEDIQDATQLKKHMADQLSEYNQTTGVIRMNLVLFKDACEHGIRKF